MINLQSSQIIKKRRKIMTKLELAIRNRKIEACKTSTFVDVEHKEVKLSLSNVSDKTKLRSSAYNVTIR